MSPEATPDRPVAEAGWDAEAEAVRACPECAADLTVDGSVRVGHRRRGRASIVLGGLLFAGMIGAGGWWIWDDVRAFDWSRAKPVWWLSLDAAGDARVTAVRALHELLRRQSEGELTDAQINPVLTRVSDDLYEWCARFGCLDYGLLDVVPVARDIGHRLKRRTS